ncbi:MAG TPA: acyl carrier protein [Stellaceae bacterium]|nr:acyl carrier protein [Stellaceae bacterium]
MTHPATLDIVKAELAVLIADKTGTAAPEISADAVLLEGGLPIDSLDLATLVVALEERTGKQPFRQGFRLFRTVGELAAIFAEA